MVAIQGGMLEEANGAHGHLCRRLTCLLLALSNSCECPLSRPLLGVKRTWAVALHMSANDPKRTKRANRVGVRPSERPSIQ